MNSMGQINGLEAIDSSRLAMFKGIHAGKRAVIMGNGPSLKTMDLRFLEDEIVFGLNKIHLGFETFGFYPRYFVAVDDLVIAQAYQKIRQISCVKFITHRAAGLLRADPLTFHINTDHALPGRFYHDITTGVREGHTVMHATLQIARYMGFREVVIIGMDHRFETKAGPNQVGHMKGPDPNHFTASYFAGHDWNGPNLEQAEVSYTVARAAYEAEGRRIIDATPNGACTIFEKADYRTLFRLPDPDPAAYPGAEAAARRARMQAQQLAALSAAASLHHADAAARQAEIDKIYRSLSWRITAPLRALRRWVRF